MAYETVCRDPAQLSGYDGGAGSVAIDLPVNGLDERDLSGEEFMQALQECEVDTAMKLNCGETSFVRGAGDLVGIERLEDAYAFDVDWKMWCDLRDVCGGDAAWAGGKDEAKCIGAEFGGKFCVLKIRVGADFDPHNCVDR